MFRCRESNPGRLGENQESLPLDHTGVESDQSLYYLCTCTLHTDICMLIYLPPISSISINEIEYILSFYYKAFNMTYP